jgi:predicted permease
MSALRRLFRNLVRSKEVEQDLADEVGSYLDLIVDEKIASGLPPDEARRAALVEMGGIEHVKESARDVRMGRHLETFVQDLRFGARSFLKRPGFTSIAVITLALGIGANTAIFSVVNGVLLRPLAYREPGDLVTILKDGRGPIAPANFLDVRADSKSFERLSAAEAWSGTLTHDRPEVVSGLRMGEDLFDLLGVPPLLGRALQAEDFRPGSGRVLVLSHKLWQRAFGGDAGVVGRQILLTGESYTVVGVMPAEFQFPPFWSTRAELWVPLDLGARAESRRASSLRVFGRLKPGVSLEQARAEIALLSGQLASAYPDANAGLDLRVDPLAEKVVGDVRPALLVLAATVVFVLLIACANVACLLLVRGQARQQETAVRAALGASRGRIVRQLLAESLILVACGAVLALGIAFAGVEWLTAALSGESTGFAVRLARLDEVKLDLTALAFTFVTAILTTVAFGLAPALAASKPNLQNVLQERGRGAPAGGRRLRETLVVVELALALVLMIGAGLLMSSFLRLRAVDSGFDPRGVLTATVSLAGAARYVGPTREAFYTEVVEELGAMPGVEAVSAINHLPLAGDVWGTRLTLEGRPLPPAGQEPAATFRVCRPDYFRTMGIPLLEGRDFTAGDTPDAPGVVMINERFAREQWPDGNAIGARITLDDPRDAENQPKWLSVVGIVEDVKQDSWMGAPSNEIYLPFHQDEVFYAGTSPHNSSMTLVIRTTSRPELLAAAVRARVGAIDPGIPVSRVVTMEQVVADVLWQPRFNLQLVGLFAALALVLAALGLYGVMAYSVMQRTQEIGLRLALGAQPRDVLKLVVGQGMRLALVGLAVGLLAAAAFTTLMSQLLFEVQSADPLTFIAVSAVMALVALLACWIPARRAARVDPNVALRYE